MNSQNKPVTTCSQMFWAGAQAVSLIGLEVHTGSMVVHFKVALSRKPRNRWLRRPRGVIAAKQPAVGRPCRRRTEQGN